MMDGDHLGFWMRCLLDASRTGDGAIPAGVLPTRTTAPALPNPAMPSIPVHYTVDIGLWDARLFGSWRGDWLRPEAEVVSR